MSEQLRQEDCASEHLLRMGVFKTRESAVESVKAGNWNILSWDGAEKPAEPSVKHRADDIVCFIKVNR